MIEWASDTLCRWCDKHLPVQGRAAYTEGVLCRAQDSNTPYAERSKDLRALESSARLADWVASACGLVGVAAFGVMIVPRYPWFYAIPPAALLGAYGKFKRTQGELTERQRAYECLWLDKERAAARLRTQPVAPKT